MKLMIALCLLSAQTLHADSLDMLRRAIGTGDLTVMENLLASGLNPNQQDRQGQTPLAFALWIGRVPAVELLLTWHADPNAPMNSGNPSSETPLQYAIQNRNLRMASVLIAGGARIDTPAQGGRTPLHTAVAAGGLDMIQLLIYKGADPNARDAEGASPLDDAAWNGSLDVVALLLAHGAHLNDFDTKTGATPINEAAYRGHTPMIQYLLQFHPDLGIADKKGHGPLLNAILMGKEEAALLLLAAEPKPAPFFETAMEAALTKDYSSVVAALLQRGMNVNGVVLSSGATPLAAAAASGATSVVRLLLDNNADPNEASGHGTTTPLEEAGLRGFDSIAGLLIDHGAAINHVNTGSGITALYAAASFGKSTAVKLLLDRGANPNLCGEKRKTPYQVALENGYKEVAAQIENHGGAKNCDR